MDRDLEKLRSKLLNKKVFFDFDGVLMTYHAKKNQVHIDEPTYLRRFIRTGDPYYASRTPERMIEFVNSLDSMNIYVLSAVATSFEGEEKRRVLRRKYPNFYPDNIIFVGRSSYKAIVADEMYKQYWMKDYKRKDIYLIDDTTECIQQFEENGFSALHISEFL